jgi:hypothetical protein
VQAIEPGPYIFKTLGVTEALRRIMTGSLSFTRDRSPYYVPSRIELQHELIHVLHNGRGENRERIVVGLQQEWTNPEEYWTIAGPTPSENTLGAVLGLPPHYSHIGMPLDLLDLTEALPKSPEYTASFRDFAGF